LLEEFLFLKQNLKIKNINMKQEKDLAHFFALLGSVMLGEAELTKEMLDKGVNINGKVPDYQIEMEIEKDPDSHPHVSHFDTPLLVAVKTLAHNKIIKLLLERGADAEMKDENGKTALDIAKERKLFDVVKIFEDYKLANV
jgi:ankyrin repeat protein